MYMLQCRADVTFLSMVTLVWSYYCDGDCMYLRYNTSVCAVLGFTSYTHQPYMKFAQFYVTRTQKCVNYDYDSLHLFKGNRNADRLMNRRGDHTKWPRIKMEHGGRIQYCRIQKWITLKIGTTFLNGLYIPARLCIDSFESHVRLYN